MQNIDQFANDENLLREDVMEQLFFGFAFESVVFFGPLKMNDNLPAFNEKNAFWWIVRFSECILTLYRFVSLSLGLSAMLSTL